MFKRNSFHFELGNILPSHGTFVVEKGADGRRVPRQGAVSGGRLCHYGWCHRFQGLAIPIKNLGFNDRPVRRRLVSLFDKTKRPPIQPGECFPPRGSIR